MNALGIAGQIHGLDAEWDGEIVETLEQLFAMCMLKEKKELKDKEREALKAAERPSANASLEGETKVAKEATNAIKKKIRVRFKVKKKRKRPATSEVGDANAGSSRGSKARL